MRRGFLLSVVALWTLSIGVALSAQRGAAAGRPAPDVIAASGGNITIRPVTHGTVEIAYGQTIVLVDPARAPFGEPPPPMPASGNPADIPPPDPNRALDASTTRLYAGLPTPSLILVTDIHEDHLDAGVIKAVRTSATKVVAPAAGAGDLKSTPGVTTIANGETKTIDGVAIEAVAMYNLTPDPQSKQTFHTKGRGNGYVVTLGGKRLYFAGDTDCTPEMKALKNIDIAFLPMNPPFSMSAAGAAECAKAFKPVIVYPYHYLGPDMRKAPAQFEAAVKGSGIEVRVREWYSTVPPEFFK